MADIKGIHHLAIKCNGVKSYEKTIAFYRDVLCLSVARTWGEGEDSITMLDTGSGILEIFAKGAVGLPNGVFQHFAFDVKDTDKCVEKVRKAGFEIIMEPQEICIPSNPPYCAKIAFCRGVNGEEVEFFQVK